MADKTLGQVAFEAYQEYFKQVTAPENRKTWDDCMEIDQAVWDFAAQAVVDKFVQGKATTFDERITRERAVIEAARAWYKKETGDYLADEEMALYLAIEALVLVEE